MPSIVWIGLGLGILAFILLINFLPIHLRIRWRKPWAGSLVIRWRLSWVLILFNLQLAGGRWRWQGDSTVGSERFSLVLKRLGLPKRAAIWIPILSRLSARIRVMDGQGRLEVGLADPALTGQWIGVIAGLPPGLARQVRLSFSHQGWRSQGSLVLGGRLVELWDPVCRLLWHYWTH